MGSLKEGGYTSSVWGGQLQIKEGKDLGRLPALKGQGVVLSA